MLPGTQEDHPTVVTIYISKISFSLYEKIVKNGGNLPILPKKF